MPLGEMATCGLKPFETTVQERLRQHPRMPPRTFKACAPCRSSKQKCTIAPKPTKLACQRCSDRGLPCSPEIIHIIRSDGDLNLREQTLWTPLGDVGQWESVPVLVPDNSNAILTQETLEKYLAGLGDGTLIKASATRFLDAEFHALQMDILQEFPEPTKSQLEDYPIPPLSFIPKLVALGCNYAYHGDYSVNKDYILKWLYAANPHLVDSMVFAGINLTQESPIFENRALYRVSMEARLTMYIRKIVSDPTLMHALPLQLETATLTDYDNIIAQLVAIQLFSSDLVFVGKVRQGVLLNCLTMWMGERSGVLLQPPGTTLNPLRYPTCDGMVAPENYGCGVGLWTFPNAKTDPWRWVRCETLRRLTFKTAHWAFLSSVLDGSRAYILPEGLLLTTGFPQNDGWWENLMLPVVPPLRDEPVHSSCVAADEARLRSMNWMTMQGQERRDQLAISMTDFKNTSSFGMSIVVLTLCARAFVLQLWAKQHKLHFNDAMHETSQLIAKDLRDKVKGLGDDMHDWYEAWPAELKQLDDKADVKGWLQLGISWFGKHAGGRILRQVIAFHELRIRVIGKVATLDHGEVPLDGLSLPWFPSHGEGAKEAMAEAIQIASYAKNMLAVLNGDDEELREELRSLVFAHVPPLLRTAVIHLNVSRYLSKMGMDNILIEQCRRDASDIANLLRCIAEGFPTARAAADFVDDLARHPDRSFTRLELREMTRAIWPLFDLAAPYDDNID
jgi:hypothetical protein